MKKIKEIIGNKRVILPILGVLLISILSISYAFFTLTETQDEYNTFKVGVCLSVTITEESDAISLTSAKPQTVEEGLNNTPYTFTIKNNCDKKASYQISLESLNLQENSLDLNYVDVSLEDSEGRITTNILGSLVESDKTIENAYDARRLISGQLDGNSTTYYKLRLWLDYDATIEQAEKVYTSKIVVSARDNIEVDEEVIKVNYQELASTPGNNGWYKSYSTKVNIIDTKDTNITAKYCVGASTCTPSVSATLENNSFSYEYPNGTNIMCVQASDSKGNRSKVTCNNEIKIDTNNPSIKFELGTNTKGEEDWYKELDINVIGEDKESGVSSLKYCITSSETCEPTEVVLASSKTITFNTNINSQKVCAQVIDNNGNTSDLLCSSSYKVDKDIPTTSISSSSSTTDSITISVSGSDTTSGISKYYYKIGSGSYSSSTSTTNTFTGLSDNTSYTISVYVVDKAGNTSQPKTSTITTKQAGISIDTIISNSNYKTTTPNFSQMATDEGVYRTSDGMYGGYTYYWRGAATTNHVIFANKCWRIVRINGDKTIRLIYNGTPTGTTCPGNGASSSIAVSNQTYNLNYNRSEYVGWTYTNGSQRTTGGTASNAKTKTENWYSSNITGTNASKVADGKFCNDRNVTAAPSGWGNGGYVTAWSASGTKFAYAGAKRLYTDYAPTLNCNSGDIYTLKIGAITADEVAFAGGGLDNNFSYYLYNGENYWTMTPGFWESGALVFTVRYDGYLGCWDANTSGVGLRPVINLRSDTTFELGGTGTSSNPYIVKD